VPRYAFSHFVVEGLSGGDEANRRMSSGFDLSGEPKREGALAGSGAAEYEDCAGKFGVLLHNHSLVIGDLSAHG
jgi:hypothetical protein